MTKFIFVTGGVVSGLGKGITAASLGRLLKMRGYKVAAQKLDPYINVDPGTMSPLQHGEVFVTEDGAETDLDLGHYERFIDENLTRYSNLTTGKVYLNVLTKEREGVYLGQTIQVIPHITDEIRDFIYKGAEESEADILITEIGGTIGDIESQPFLEAIRQISLKEGKENCLNIHVTLVPYISGSGELKSKPTQHSVRELQSLGISPGIIVARCESPLPESLKEKIAMFCNVSPECVIDDLTIDNLYSAPVMLHNNGLDGAAVKLLNLNGDIKPDVEGWEKSIKADQTFEDTVKIALVGKYTDLHDAYLSVVEALHHSGAANGANIEILWTDSESLNDENACEKLKDADGVLVPGGFGKRGTEGMISACRAAKKLSLPYLGICLGMQVLAITFARDALSLSDANSTEFNKNTNDPVIDLMEDQRGDVKKGGTMRLGAYPCRIGEGTLLKRLYGENNISERHRHRYEFNNDYKEIFEQNGAVFSGVNPELDLAETMEIPGEKFFLGVQYHPEFKSRPNKPHPVFKGFVEAAKGHRGEG